MLSINYNKLFKDVKDINKFLQSFKPPKKISDRPLRAIINCDSWRILRPATPDDNVKSKAKIINRLKNAFWL